MTTKDELLAALIANPDDDLPRLIYADYLDENDEPERATRIRRQVAASARGETRGQFFTNGLGGAITVPAAINTPMEMLLGWERGFIGFVKCTAEDWFREADHIVPVNPPIELVTLTTPARLTFGEITRREGMDNERRRYCIYHTWHVHTPLKTELCGTKFEVSEIEMALARDARTLIERTRVEVERDVERARSILGYLNMKWGDKGDRKGHVKKWRLLPDRFD